MRGSKLHKILHSFSTSERLRFQKFLQSPYFNQREDLRQLFEFWAKNAPNPQEKLDDTSVWAALNTGKPFKKNDFHLACSRLLALAEIFMTYQELYTEVHWQPIRLLRSCRKRHLTDQYQHLLLQMKVAETAQPLRDKDHLFRQYRRELEYYEELASRPRNPEVNLQVVSDAFQQFSIAECLRQACLMQAHQSVFKKQYETGILPFVLEFLEQHPAWLEEPAIAAYFYCYKASVTTGQVVYFQKLRDIFTRYRTAFPDEEIRAIYRHVLNLCIRRLNEGESAYQTALFHLYQTGLEEGILHENGFLPATTFKNIISIALKMEEKDWVEDFIGRFIRDVAPARREEVKLYNLGKLRFAQKKFDAAMPLLAQLRSEDPLVMLDAKVLQAKMLYETHETVVLEDFLHSFKSFLRRQSISEGFSEYFNQIIALFTGLLHLSPGDVPKKEILRQAVHQLKVESDKIWFLNQL